MRTMGMGTDNRATVALDARWILPQPSGIGVYTRELLRRLPALAPDLRFLAVFQDAGLRDRLAAELELDAQANLESVCVPFGVFDPRGQLALPGQLRRWGVRLFHAPNYMIPYRAFPRDRGGRIGCVVTIHDVIPFVLRDHAPRSRKSRLWPLFCACMRQTIARSDRILTVSETSRRDLGQALNLAASRMARIRVVYNGVDATFSPPQERAAAPAGNAPRTLLCVGRMDPYKNIPLLIRAVAQLREDLPFAIRLRVIGPDDPRYPEARLACAAAGLEACVSFEGFLSASALAEAYRTADLLVHPSRYEGFGLQVLEAMRSGLPVVCTRGGALPEVSGGAAHLVETDDMPALADAIRRVLTDPVHAARLSRLGRERAAAFTWARTAAGTLSVFREVLETLT